LGLQRNRAQRFNPVHLSGLIATLAALGRAQEASAAARRLMQLAAGIPHERLCQKLPVPGRHPEGLACAAAVGGLPE